MGQFLFSLLDLILPPKRANKIAESTTIDMLQRKITRPSTPLPESAALFSYRDQTVRALVWALKYHKNERAANLFGELLAEEIVEEAESVMRLSGKRPLLIPLPLSPLRLRHRGFNQTELLARAMLLSIPDLAEMRTDILKKTRETKRQTEILRKPARAKNIAGAFSVSNPSALSGRTVILLDDVITTGSTMREARKALLEAGARKVISLAVGH